MEKVKVSSQVAKDINFFKEKGYSICDLMINAYTETERRAKNIILKDVPEDVLIEVYRGNYEVEQTPEEILLTEYEKLSDYDDVDRACKDSFRFVLDTLGIEIERINK